MSRRTSFVSPNIYHIETDLSQLPRAVSQIGGAFIGVTKKGPAFLPTQVASFSDFRARFGDLNTKMYVPYAVQRYLQHAPVATVVRVLGKGDPANGYTVDLGRAFVLAFGTTNVNNTAAGTFNSNLTAVETVAVLRSRQSGGTDIINNVSITGTASNFTIDIGGTVFSNISLDRTQKNYIKNIFGTDPKRAFNGDSATGIYIDSVWDYRVSTYTGSYTGSTYGSANNPSSASTTGLRYISGGYKTAATPMIVSQPYINGSVARVYDLFRLIARTDGEASNKDVKISIQDIETSTTSPKIAPKFTIVVRDYTDTDSRPAVLETFRVDLNSESDFFISKVIGDRYQTVVISGAGETPETKFEGDYPNKSSFVRVELADGYKFDCRPAGFKGLKTINPNVGALENDIPLKTDHLNEDGFKSSKVFLGFDYEGTDAIGFEDRLKGTITAVDGTTGSRGFLITATSSESTTFTPSVTAAYNASLTSDFTFVDTSLTGNANIIEGGYWFSLPLCGGHDGIPPSQDYDVAINNGTLSAEFKSALATVANADEQDINLLVIPGVHSGASTYNGQIVSRAYEMCEDRGDTFYIMDSGKSLAPSASNITTDAKDTSVAEAVESVLGYDTNYAATYYPWVRIYDGDVNRMVFVPPSVPMSGVIAYTDKVSRPWYAPAGPNRGMLNDAIEVRKRLTQDHRDTLYTGRVNPVAYFVNQGIMIDGQKTLQKTASALDRISVRRLLLYIKKVVANIGRTAIFEFNDARNRQKLRDALNPIFERIQLQQGLNRFQIIIDETNNTPDVIDRNQMRGTIILEPTRVAEILIFNYVITRTGAKFEEVLQSIQQ